MFGVSLFVHVKKGKSEARVERCIFIQYVHGVKRYKLWRLDLREVRYFMSKDVTFDNTRMTMMCKDITFDNIQMTMMCRDLEKRQEKIHVEVESWSLLLRDQIVWRHHTMFTNLLPQ